MGVRNVIFCGGNHGRQFGCALWACPQRLTTSAIVVSLVFPYILDAGEVLRVPGHCGRWLNKLIHLPSCVSVLYFRADTRKPLTCTSTSIGNGKGSRWNGKSAFPFVAISLGWTTCVLTLSVVLRSETSGIKSHRREYAPSITAAPVAKKHEVFVLYN